MRKTNVLIISFLFAFVLQNKAQVQDSIYGPKSFINLGLLGMLCTNGEDTQETTNNISISLFHGSNKNVYGFALAPINFIESSMCTSSN